MKDLRDRYGSVLSGIFEGSCLAGYEALGDVSRWSMRRAGGSKYLLSRLWRSRGRSIVCNPDPEAQLWILAILLGRFRSCVACRLLESSHLLNSIVKEKKYRKIICACFGGLGGVAGVRATSKALCQLNEVAEMEVCVEKYLWLFARRRVGWHDGWSGIATGAGL